MTQIFYSFRRCPYAMRARLALAYSQQTVQLREIILKEKPPEMLALSAKGTIPVLQLENGEVLDESLDIMAWALSQNDPNQWLAGNIHTMLALIDENDFEFKPWLDKYKYADRFPNHCEVYYRECCEDFLISLENRLITHRYLFSDNISLADMAIFPFIRQFAGVDKEWFKNCPYPKLKTWLDCLTNGPLFTTIMHKYPIWKDTGETTTFP